MAEISFLGDISLNDNYIQLAREGANPFEIVSPLLQKSDLVVGNLECLSEGKEGENTLKKPRLKTTLETLEYLQTINLGLATLAHNHVYDNLYDGFSQTMNFLDDKHIAHLGAGTNVAAARKPYIVNYNGLSICFLNFATDDTNPSLPENAKIHLNVFQLNDCIKELKSLSEYTFRVVLMHWGGKFENGLLPDFNQPEIARKMIDAGADLIIGHHSHTFQPYEKYKNKYIFYSLGNFCFSDIEFEGKKRSMSAPRNRESAIVKVNFKTDGYTVKVLPIRNNKLNLEVVNRLHSKYRIRNLVFFILSKSRFLWYFYSLHFKVIRPVISQLRRKDPERSFLQRIRELNLKKLQRMVNQ